MAWDFARRTGHPLPEGAGFAAALCAIVLIGGAGRAYPLLQAIVEAISALLLAASLARHGLGGGQRRDWLALAAIAVALALPALQLIPIPFESWSALPGRALPAGIVEAAGIAPAAMPLTLDPAATRQAMLAMLPALALFAAGRALSPAGRVLAIRTVLALAAVSACLGAVQVVMGPVTSAPAFASAHLGQGIGLFVNRNHQATFLLVAICLSATLLRGDAQRPGGRRDAWLALGLMLLLAAAVLATTSRTALALLPLCLLPAALQLRRRRRLGMLLAAGLFTLFAAWAWWSGALSRVISRIQDEPDVRMTFWRTSWKAVGEYWPVGSGIGSFRSVYRLFEDRGDLMTIFVNHAHNDYLELLLEGGALASVGMLLFAAWYARRIWNARRGAGGADAIVLSGLAVVLAFSTVEYPLRTLSLMALFGLLCALADRPAAQAAAPRPSGGAAAPRRQPGPPERWRSSSAASSAARPRRPPRLRPARCWRTPRSISTRSRCWPSPRRSGTPNRRES